MALKIGKRSGEPLKISIPVSPLLWYTGQDMCHTCSLGGCVRREDKMIGVRCCMMPLHPPTRGVYQAWKRDLAWFPC